MCPPPPKDAMLISDRPDESSGDGLQPPFPAIPGVVREVAGSSPASPGSHNKTISFQRRMDRDETLQSSSSSPLQKISIDAIDSNSVALSQPLLKRPHPTPHLETRDVC